MQQARWTAKAIKRALAGKDLLPFAYFDKGSLATIGRSRAIAMVDRMHLTGFVAWMAWLFVHIFYLIGFKNRIVVDDHLGLVVRDLPARGAPRVRQSLPAPPREPRPAPPAGDGLGRPETRTQANQRGSASTDLTSGPTWSNPGNRWANSGKALAHRSDFINHFGAGASSCAGCSASCFSTHHEPKGALCDCWTARFRLWTGPKSKPEEEVERAPMKIVELVDDLYEAFAERIGPPLSASARDLPRALRLAPIARPWSRVFPHEITLGAPGALRRVAGRACRSSLTRDAVLAHMLAVIDSYGTARIEDERIEASPHVFAVLGHARTRA